MKNALTGPKQRSAFQGKSRQLIIAVAALFLSFSAAAQTRNNIQRIETPYSYPAFEIRKLLYLPQDTFPTTDSNNISVRDRRLYLKLGNKYVDVGCKRINDSTLACLLDTFLIRGSGGSTDTTSLSARIDLKLDSIKRRLDSVFIYRGGVEIFAYKDSVGSGGGGSGTVNTGTQYRLAYYAAAGTAVSENAAITGNRALASDANGLPVATSTTATELGYVNGVTSAIQTQLNGKVNNSDTSTMLSPYPRKPVGGDLAGNLPDPRLAHTVTGTGTFVQVKNNVVIGDTIVRLGQIFADNFARATLGSNYGTSGSQSISFPSSAYLQITGGLDYTNNVYRTDYTGVNRWIDSVRFTTGTPGGATYGLIINFYDPVNYATGIRVQFGTATGGLTNIYFRHYDGTQLAASASPQTISAGDSLLAIVERRDNTFICTYKNLTTGATATTLTHTYSTLTSGAQPAPASGRMAIGSLGGTQNISYWSHTSNEVKYQAAVVSNSIASGGYSATTMGQSWPDIVFSSREQWARFGGAGDRSSDAINYIPQLRADAPRIVYYALGVNDALNSVTGATYSANVQQFLDSCEAIGITPILVQLPPQNTVLTKPYSDTLQAIASRRGLTFIDGIYDALRSGTAYAGAYSSDGIHPNDAGHKIIAGLVSAQSSAVGYNLTLLNIPSDSTGSDRILKRDSLGRVTTGIYANQIQKVGDPFRAGSSITLPSGATPGMSVSISSSNGFVTAVQNTNSNGWSGGLFYNHLGVFTMGEGWQNAGATSGNGAISDSTFMFKTYNRSTGRFAFFAGDNQTSAAFADLLIYRGAILPGRHVAAGRTVNPTSGMFYYDTDSSEFVIFTGTAWAKYSRTGLGLINPMTTTGDLIIGGASGTPTRLPGGTGNQMLGMNSGGTAQEYKTITGSGSINVAHAANSITLTVPTSYLTGGSYAPTTTLVTNVDGATVQSGQYIRIGSIITGSLSIDIDPTAAGGVEVGLSLPSPSTFSTSHICSGTVNADGIAGQVTSDATNSRIRIVFTAPDGTSRNFRINFQYTETSP
jgi:lysophospholipase L1-like esterase